MAIAAPAIFLDAMQAERALANFVKEGIVGLASIGQGIGAALNPYLGNRNIGAAPGYERIATADTAKAGASTPPVRQFNQVRPS